MRKPPRRRHVLRDDTLALFEAVGMEESFMPSWSRPVGAMPGQWPTPSFPPVAGRAGRVWSSGFTRRPSCAAASKTPSRRTGCQPARAREILDFFTSDTGRRVVAGELAAWRAITDPEVEATAIALYEERQADGDPRIDLLTRLIASNDFVDLNVMAALNSNYAFLLAMSDGGAYERPIPQDMILQRVWQQEPRIREEATEWLYAFQLMAYADLTDAELEAYIAFLRIRGRAGL